MNRYKAIEGISETRSIEMKEGDEGVYLVTKVEPKEVKEKRMRVLEYMREKQLMNVEDIVRSDECVMIVERLSGFISLRHLLFKKHTNNNSSNFNHHSLSTKMISKLTNGIMIVLLHLHALGEYFLSLSPLTVLIEVSTGKVLLSPQFFFGGADLLGDSGRVDPYSFTFETNVDLSVSSCNYSLMDFNESFWFT